MTSPKACIKSLPDAIWTQALSVLLLCTQFPLSGMVALSCASCLGQVLPALAGNLHTGRGWEKGQILVRPKLWTGDLDCFHSLTYDFFSLWRNEPCHLTPAQEEGKQYSVCLKERTMRSTAPKPCFKSFAGVGALESRKSNSSRFSIAFF